MRFKNAKQRSLYRGKYPILLGNIKDFTCLDAYWQDIGLKSSKTLHHLPTFSAIASPSFLAGTSATGGEFLGRRQKGMAMSSP
jgi:hypothetical protein